ncbi:IpaD/SipD/SspD family type III secretion system needle tip protein [Pseudomonas chlororaphis subsp. aurantiaca]|uniref:IpaD/SipD/SspD family type III secretion system needle tip protein n=1 Tax=Pseudomonas chlororaphis TaxID=587753 RepID=UPI0027DE5E2F|nr:IpaD/SipD/SspD family type III secretion system needle tip protein [Pseudomonas chlororaphis]WMI97550.1 IpaD/SipD/SspD family type III secretion system needle tip protein [Pseudomonas chlororaphis subsp. aurantiaca]
MPINLNSSAAPTLVRPGTERLAEPEVHGEQGEQFLPREPGAQPFSATGARLDALSGRLEENAKTLKAFTLPAAVSTADIDSDPQGVSRYLQAQQVAVGQASRGLQKLSEATGTTKVSEQVVEAELRKLAQSPEGQSLAPEFTGETLEKLLAAMPGAYAAGASAGAPDFFKTLEDMIAFIKTDYLAVYENALKQYSDFYKEFNEKVMSKMGDWVTGKDDGKKVELDFKSLIEALKSLIAGVRDRRLYPVEANKSVSKQDAEKWATAIGLPSSCVIQQNGRWQVIIDVSPLGTMVAELERINPYWNGGSILGAIPKYSMDSSKFQAWQTGFNSQESELKNQLQMLTTKYGNANSYHENFNKILSSQLSQYAEMLKNMAAAIG